MTYMKMIYKKSNNFNFKILLNNIYKYLMNINK